VMKEEEMVINTENYCKTDELVDGQKCIILRLDNIHSAKAVTKISQLREQEKTNKVFNKVWASPDLQNFHINKFNLGCVDQDILSSLPPDLRILSLVETGLGEEQVLSLLTGIGKHDNLTSLSLEGEDLTSVDNQTLAGAVGKLGKLSIRNCYIDTDQIVTILQCVSKLKNLTEVTLAGTEDEPVYLTEVAPDLLGASITCLQNACISHAEVTRHQVEIILQKVLLNTSSSLSCLVLDSLVQEDESAITETEFKSLATKVCKKLKSFEFT